MAGYNSRAGICRLIRNFENLVQLFYNMGCNVEGSHSGLVRAPAKRLPGLNLVVGSNPTPSAIRVEKSPLVTRGFLFREHLRQVETSESSWVAPAVIIYPGSGAMGFIRDFIGEQLWK